MASEQRVKGMKLIGIDAGILLKVRGRIVVRMMVFAYGYSFVMCSLKDGCYSSLWTKAKERGSGFEQRAINQQPS